jgi:hypothetical protein
MDDPDAGDESRMKFDGEINGEINGEVNARD